MVAPPANHQSIGALQTPGPRFSSAGFWCVAPRKFGGRLVAEPPAVWMEQGKPMMNRFGQLGLTTVSNGLNFVAQTIGILSQTHGQMYAYVMATVRIPISRLQMNSR